MSAQAMGWALDQPIPSRAKLLLVALANHADHTTGYCWPSVDTLMRETSMSRRAIFGYLGALRRNGYLESRPAHGKDGRQRSNDYWILFDRVPAEWVHLKKEEEHGDEENSSIDELPQSEDTKNAPLPENAVNPIPAPPPCNPCTPIIEPLDSNRQSLQLKDGQALKPARPKDFSSQARTEEQFRLKAAEEARKGDRIFVFRDSDPWNYHVRNGHPRTLFTWSTVHKREGWWFKTEDCQGLYPKPKRQSTGPPDPDSDLMSPDDYKEFKWG